MRSIWIVAALAGALAAPAASFAQGTQPESRAQVLTQLQQLADAGYRGNGDETSYPSDVQAAQRRVQGRQGVAEPNTPADTSGYGAQPGTKSESGNREPRGPGSLYFGS